MSYLLNDEGKKTLKQFLNKVSKTQGSLGKYIAEIETDANERLDMGKEVFFVLHHQDIKRSLNTLSYISKNITSPRFNL